MIALLLFALQAQPAAPVPDRYDGRMTVTYMPIYCHSPRCPPGNYSIAIPGRPRVTVRTVVYAPPPGVATPGRAQGDGVNIEGSVTFARDAAGRAIEARIVPRRVASGLWKP